MTGGGAGATVPALQVTAVVKRYRRTTALAGVDLEVGPGEVVGLLGPNGAGKSTLMKIVCGLVRADSGRVVVGGAPAGTPEAARRLGHLAELFRFPGFLTPREVLALHARLAGADGTDLDALLARVGVEAYADRPVDELSKGNQQRLGIAQALLGDPALVLLDEPTSALDPIGRELVRDLLVQLRAAGTAVLLNSHALSDVEATCDRVVMLRDGVVVLDAPVEELVADAGGADARARALTERYIAVMTAP